ncbi:MAG: STAS domain-containing protein [Planctomycetes bacterium]|nr:STAS domain-containing protein [Planctomycetota bacterium]
MELTKEGLLSSQVIDGVVVIGFNRGRIRDEREILKTLESLGRFVEAKSGLKIVLDLSSVEYLSSAGLGHLVGLLKKARSRESVLKLCGLRDPIHELFEVMRLDKIFEIHGTAKDATDSFKGAARAAGVSSAPAPGTPKA